MLPSSNETFGGPREYSNSGQAEEYDTVRHIVDGDVGTVIGVTDYGLNVTVDFESDGVMVCIADCLEFVGD